MMKGTLAAFAALSVSAVSAHAEVRRPTYQWTDPSLIGSEYTPPEAAAVSHIIFMNPCTGGCTLYPGGNDAPNNRSSIIGTQRQISQYSGSAANWNAILNCVRQTYAPFDIQVVDQRPPAGTQYHMAIVAGTPQQAGQGNGVLGVSPFSCGYIPNSISFTFANLEPTNILDLCWTVAQETAHSWGLDHKYDNRDPMTYLGSGPAMKLFQNEAGSCGEFNARACQCSYAGTPNKMNSYKVIMDTFGSSAPDVAAPTVTITAPTKDAQVMPGFPVRATLNDDRAVTKAEFKLDGQVVGTITAAPWVWNAPTNLSKGAHKVEVFAYDAANNSASASVNVQYGSPCSNASQCADKQVCVGGHCVAGPETPGGLGNPCTNNGECASGQCASDGTNAYCVEACDTANPLCPADFSCISAGAGGVCWPGGGDEGGGGGCSSNGSSGTILLGLGFAALLITRRRR